MKKIIFIMVISASLLCASGSEAILHLLFKDHFNKVIIPTSPNPVVLMVKGRQFEDLHSRTVRALRSIGYSVHDRSFGSRDRLGNEIHATLITESPYVKPTEADVIRAEVSVTIVPEDNDMHIIAVKGEKFGAYVHGNHRPDFLVANDVAKVIEQQLVPSVIMGDKMPDTGKFYIADTAYTIDDINRLKVYCKPDRAKWEATPAFTLGKEFELCQRQLETIGGYVKLLDPGNVSFFIDKDYLVGKGGSYGHDHIRNFEYYIKYYKFRMEVFNIRTKPDTAVDMPYEVMTMIVLKDGKTVTLPGIRDDIFRKRLF